MSDFGGDRGEHGDADVDSGDGGRPWPRGGDGPLCAVVNVGPREIGPVSSITLMIDAGEL